ncbi:MAG TPA: Xaa-Pro peptidase family protein [Solirubrobacteraceae bacterium]
MTTEDFAGRVIRAAEQAAANGLSGLLVTPGPDLAYFTGYRPMIGERLTLAAVQAGREPVMIVPSFERPGAEAAPGMGAFEIIDWTDGEDPYAFAARVLDPRGRYAVSDAAWALHVLALQGQLPDAHQVSMSAALPTLRAIKDANEVELLAAAGAAVDSSFEEILGVQFAGRPEIDIAAELAERLLAHGHSEVEFTLVGSGPNGANPHHEVGARTIREGDMVVLDFGGMRDGYGSDITRTVHVGEPSAQEREVYEIVRDAQQAGVEAVAPGVPCQEVDRAARAVIADAGYGEHFVHRVGHGIGLTVHEPPYMVEGETRSIEPGMCFSVEPGIYLRDRFGVRIEDIVAATADGVRRLNNCTRELQIVS